MSSRDHSPRPDIEQGEEQQRYCGAPDRGGAPLGHATRDNGSVEGGGGEQRDEHAEPKQDTLSRESGEIKPHGGDRAARRECRQPGPAVKHDCAIGYGESICEGQQSPQEHKSACKAR